MTRQSQHTGVLSGTVILQHIRLGFCLAKLTGNFLAERLVRTTFQCALIKADLAQHRSDSFGMNRFAAMGAARYCDFFFSEPEPIGCAGSNQRQRLVWLAGRAQKSHRLWRSKLGQNITIWIDCGDVPAMS